MPQNLLRNGIGVDQHLAGGVDIKVTMVIYHTQHLTKRRKRNIVYYKYIKEALMAMNQDMVKTLMKECTDGNLDTETVLYAALSKLDELGENLVYDLAIEQKFISTEDFIPDVDETDIIEKEIDEDVELTAQQKIIEKVLARYGDV
jgi:hypothetical protein